MKNLTWKQWTILAVFVAFIIFEIVVCFINPLAAVSGGIGFILGILGTYLFIKFKKNIQ